jgi:hypothetical protein
MTPSGLFVAASLHASLMARLDRLGPAKEVAQIGAAVGHKHVPHDLHPEKREGALVRCDRVLSADLRGHSEFPLVPLAMLACALRSPSDAANGTRTTPACVQLEGKR